MKEQSFTGTEVIFENEVFRVHYLEPKEATQIRPVLVVPPHAGRHGCIAQRMCDTCCSVGAHTYTFDLKSATQETKNTSIEDLVAMLTSIDLMIYSRHLNNDLDIIGLCQGAWLSAIYTSIFPKRVARYANFAGPINTNTGQDNAIEKYINSWPSVDDMMKYHRNLVNNNNGIQPGTSQWMSFSMVRPSYVYMERFFNLMWAHHDVIMNQDDKALKKFHRNNDWYDYCVDLAGNWFLDCLENHFAKNKLYDGTWKVAGDTVDLSNITCDVFLYAGDDDDITHPQQVSDMANVVSSKWVKYTLFKNAGHTKVFVGTKELETFKQDFFGE